VTGQEIEWGQFWKDVGISAGANVVSGLISEKLSDNLTGLANELVKSNNTAMNPILTAAIAGVTSAGTNYVMQLGSMAFFDEEGNFSVDFGRVSHEDVDWGSVTTSGIVAVAQDMTVRALNRATAVNDDNTNRETSSYANEMSPEDAARYNAWMDNAESMAGMSSVEYYASLEDDFYSDRIGNGYYDGYDYSDFESERNHSERSPKEGAAFAEKVAYEEMLSRQFEPMGSTDGVYHDGATGIVGGAGKTGTLVIEAGSKFSAIEIKAAEYP